MSHYWSLTYLSLTFGDKVLDGWNGEVPNSVNLVQCQDAEGTSLDWKEKKRKKMTWHDNLCMIKEAGLELSSTAVNPDIVSYDC